jgi:hypothetical protein
MPLALLLIGGVIVVTAYQGTYRDFYNQVVSDFSGGKGQNFIYWVGAVALVGMLGYSKTFRTPARLLLGLIILSFFIANRGVFTQLTSGVSNIKPDTNAVVEPSAPGALPIQISGASGSGSGSTISGIAGAISGIAKLFGGGGTGGLL